MVIARDISVPGPGSARSRSRRSIPRAISRKLVLAMLGVAAKVHAARIAERTALGRADAEGEGREVWRKPKLTPHQRREALERVAAGEVRNAASPARNVDQATISRLRVC